jgi:Pyruvate/2-oxoacid:ferredoxin oxidoreductase delta subunit
MSRIHVITGEHSRIRRWTLYLFARYIELPLLKWGYLLLCGRCQRFGRNRLVRALLSWAVAAPFGYLGDTARPLPTPQTLALIDSLEGPIAVGPCRCRSSHGGCDHPLETDLVIYTGVAAWTRAFPHEYRVISKDEAKAIVSHCRQLGLWQMVFVHCPVNRENEYVICNCCTCGCVPYILNRELGQRVYPLLRGEYLAVTDPARCTGHGTCVAACPFDARAMLDGKADLAAPCFGCGLCVDVCPEGAIVMRQTLHATGVSVV